MRAGYDARPLLFNSVEFAVFFVVVFFAYWALARTRTLRLVLLTSAGLFFYGSWNWQYLFLLLGTSSFDWFVGLMLGRTPSERGRKAWIAATVVSNLAMLAVFKYFDFFADTVARGLAGFGVRASVPHLDVILPVGISFYTFHSLSYTIDVYRRVIPTEKSLLKFLLFISFFPALVAGPIIRAKDFLHQIDADPRIQEGTRGVFLILCGLVKKVVIADYLAVNIVDRVFEMPERYTTLEAWGAVYGYALRIYGDFSGYSDIALGSALLMGFRLKQNFDAPYRATDLQDFWRRWHISLSSWLRDYLYVPLGGNRLGPWKTYRNLLLTMLLGGLWHGAAWTFVIWGAIHGVGLAVARALQRRREARGAPAHAPWRRLLGGFVTFHYVCLGWVFFRAQTLDEARRMLARMVSWTPGAANLAPTVLLALAAGFAFHYVPDRIVERTQETFGRLPALAQGAVVTAVVAGVAYATTSDVLPFIYFQF